jgi:hypothetical protein
MNSEVLVKKIPGLESQLANIAAQIGEGTTGEYEALESVYRNKYRTISLVFYGTFDYNSIDVELQFYKDIGFDSVVICTNDRMTTGASTTINQFMTNQELLDLINHVKSFGFKVHLKIHVTPEDMPKQDMEPDVAWFTSFKALALNYAQLCEDNGIEVYCVGAELCQMTKAVYTSYWVDIFDSIRPIYSGKITYGAAGNYELGYIGFWDELDYIGRDYYPAMTVYSQNQRDVMIDYIADLNTTLACGRLHNKPVLIAETGVVAVTGVLDNPWDFSPEDPVDYDEMRVFYEVLLQLFTHKDIVGMYVFCLFATSIGYKASLYNKGTEVENLFRRWYNA